jgi:PAS domain S-box-containing protein
MRIRTQFVITMLLFSTVLVIMAISAVYTSKLLDKANQQEKLSDSIAQGASELSYLTNEYLIYGESRQLEHWKSRFASLSEAVVNLDVDIPQQQALARNIQKNQIRLKEVFDSVVSASRKVSQSKSAGGDLGFLQVSWSRMAVQGQELVSDATRLSQMLRQEIDRLMAARSVLTYTIMALFGGLLLASYLLTYRRIIKSIIGLQEGARIIGTGNLEVSVQEGKDDEIGELSRAFNRMTAELKTVTASKADLEQEMRERRQAEEALRDSERRWAVTLSSIGDAVMATDTKGQITFLNKIAEKLTGWSMAEAAGTPVTEVFRIVNEHTRAVVEDPVSKVIQSGMIVGLANHTVLLRKDNSELPIDDSGAPIWDDAGHLFGVVLVFRDVSERRRAEETLRESEQRVRLKLESVLSPEGDLGELELADLIDTATFQKIVEDFFALARIPMSILDLKGKVLVGAGWQDICTKFHRAHPVTLQNCLDSDINLSSGLSQGETRLYKCHNGMWDMATPISVAGRHVGNIFTGQFFFDDETIDHEFFCAQARKYGFDEPQYLAALNRVPRLSRAAVERGMSFLVQLADTLSRTGFSNVKLARLLAERDRLTDSLRESQMDLERLNNNLEGAVKERTAALHAANQALKARAEQLRSLAGELTTAEQRERKNLSKILHDGLQQFLVAAKMRTACLAGEITDHEAKQSALTVENLLSESINVSRSLAAELCPPALDSGILSGMEWLSNFMANKHGLHVNLIIELDSPVLAEDVKVFLFESVRELLLNVVKHAKVASATVRLCHEGARKLRIMVSDSGAGFDAGGVLSGRNGGKGLGLFSIHERIGLFGGHLEVESSPGSGSTFSLIAPLVRNTIQTASNLQCRNIGKQETVPNDGKIRILLVDDHSVVREGLAQMLGAEDDFIVVGQAEDGQKAIEKADELHPEIVLMDVSMPNVDGITATKAIVQQHPDIRVIGLSLYKQEERAKEMLAAGASFYISKSAPASELKEAIRSCAREASR